MGNAKIARIYAGSPKVSWLLAYFAHPLRALRFQRPYEHGGVFRAADSNHFLFIRVFVAIKKSVPSISLNFYLCIRGKTIIPGTSFSRTRKTFVSSWLSK